MAARFVGGAQSIGVWTNRLGKDLQFLTSLLICASVGNFCICPVLVDELCVAFDSCISCNAHVLKWGQLRTNQN